MAHGAKVLHFSALLVGEAIDGSRIAAGGLV